MFKTVRCLITFCPHFINAWSKWTVGENANTYWVKTQTKCEMDKRKSPHHRPMNTGLLRHHDITSTSSLSASCSCTGTVVVAVWSHEKKNVFRWLESVQIIGSAKNHKSIFPDCFSANQWNLQVESPWLELKPGLSGPSMLPISKTLELKGAAV